MSRLRPGLLSELGAQLPVIAASMAGGPTTAELVVASSTVGTLGFIAGGYKTPDRLADEIHQVRARTELFGVNLFAPNPVPVDAEAFGAYRTALQPWADRYGAELPQQPQEDDDAWDAKLQLLLKDPVPVVSFTFGLPPQQTIRAFQRAGTRVVQTVTSRAEAQQAAAAGVDALVAQSPCAGGHWGTWSPGGSVPSITAAQLVAEISPVVPCPVWAAGGLATSYSVREVLAAGAEAACVGTALLRCPEAGTQPAHRRALASAAYAETVVTRAFSGRPARALRTEFTDAMTPAAPLGFPALHHLTTPLRRASAAAGDPTALNLWAGTGWRHAAEEPAAGALRRLAGA